MLLAHLGRDAKIRDKEGLWVDGKVDLLVNFFTDPEQAFAQTNGWLHDGWEGRVVQYRKSMVSLFAPPRILRHHLHRAR